MNAKLTYVILRERVKHCFKVVMALVSGEISMVTNEIHDERCIEQSTVKGRS